MVGRWQAARINGLPIPPGNLLLLELDADGRMYLNVGLGREPGGLWSLISVGGVTYLRQISQDGTYDSLLTGLGPDRFSLQSPEGDVLVFERQAGGWLAPRTAPEPSGSPLVGRWTFVTYGHSGPFVDAGLYRFADTGELQATVGTRSSRGRWELVDRDGVDYVRIELDDAIFEGALVVSSPDSLTLIGPGGEVFAMFRAR